jgi:microsomal epoxide hydrolase
MHGWPGSFLEFLPMLGLLKQKYSAADLPFNVIVPSLPGYGLSEGANTERQWSMSEGAHMLDKLMAGLGLSGYIAQGGDIGSFFSRILAVESENCKGIHCELLKSKSIESAANHSSELQPHAQARG